MNSTDTASNAEDMKHYAQGRIVELETPGFQENLTELSAHIKMVRLLCEDALETITKLKKTM